jgi:integrase
MADTKHLMQRPGRKYWYAVVEVPRELQADLGRRKTKSLRTESLKEAQRLRGPVVAEFWRQIEQQRRELGHSTTERERVLAEAQAVADERRQSDDPDHREVVSYAVDQRAGEIKRVHDADLASKYIAVANEALTPLSDKVERWLSDASMTEKTGVEYRGAVREFLTWNGGEAFSEQITRRFAGRYVAENLQRRGLQPASINRKVVALSSFWQWLVRRGFAEENVWSGQGVAIHKNQRGGDKQQDAEREFTDGEVSKLLSNAPDRSMYDFVLLLLLTGMRREEAARLRVCDTRDNAFHIQAGKNTNAPRSVPIHPDLAELVARRTHGKHAESYLFEELRENSKGKRSDAIGKRFTRFRRDIGVSEEGRGRRNAVNLHSARRWFETTAEKAGQPPWIIEAVCGQSRSGMFGRYSGGPSHEQKRACVEAVRLPDQAER